jgi:hypothetical protein
MKEKGTHSAASASTTTTLDDKGDEVDAKEDKGIRI